MLATLNTLVKTREAEKESSRTKDSGVRANEAENPDVKPTAPTSEVKRAPSAGPVIIAEMPCLETTENTEDSSSQDEEGHPIEQPDTGKALATEKTMANVSSTKNDYDHDNGLKLSNLHTSSTIDHEKGIDLPESELMFVQGTAHRTNDVTTHTSDHEQTLADFQRQLKDIRALLEKASSSNQQDSTPTTPSGVPRAITFASDAATSSIPPIHSSDSFVSNHTTPIFRRLSSWRSTACIAFHSSSPGSFSPNSSFECDSQNSIFFDEPAMRSKGRPILLRRTR